MPNTKDRGHNSPDGADLNLRLVGSGGAADRRSISRKDWVPRNDVRSRNGCSAWMRRLTVDFGAASLRPAKLAGRIGNHPNRN